MITKAEKIERKINDIGTMTSLCVKRDSAKTVIATLKYALFISTREALILVEEMCNTLKETIIDEYNLDYEKLRDIISHCITDMDNAFHLKGDGELEEMRKLYKSSAKESEDGDRKKGYDFVSCDELDSETINHSLLYYQFDVENNAFGTLVQIEKMLKGIIDEHIAFEQDGDDEKHNEVIQDLRRRFEHIEEDYRCSKWLYIKEEIKKTIRYDLRSTEKKKADYEGWLFNYKRNASILSRAYKEHPDDFVSSLYSHRNEHTEREIEELCEYIMTCRLVGKRIASFDLTTAPAPAYANLFINKACQEFMIKMAPYIAKVVNINSLYEYSALLFVMMDLGIAHKGRSNSTEFTAFLKRYFNVEVQPDNINKRKRKLLDDSFANMSYEQLESSYGKNEFENLKDKYWSYFTVLNSVLKYDTKNFALTILEFDHVKTTELLEDYPIDLDDNLDNLISVVKGEYTDF